MSDYKIRMNLEVFRESDPTDKVDITYQTGMTDNEAESIDMVERIFIDLNREVLKSGISEHLEKVSKKMPNPLGKIRRMH